MIRTLFKIQSPNLVLRLTEPQRIQPTSARELLVEGAGAIKVTNEKGTSVKVPPTLKGKTAYLPREYYSYLREVRDTLDTIIKRKDKDFIIYSYFNPNEMSELNIGLHKFKQN